MKSCLSVRALAGVSVLSLSGLWASVTLAEGPTRGFDRGKLNIGAYYLSEKAQTEDHVRDVRDCGVDFLVSMSGGAQMRKTYDLLHKYGIGAFVILTSPYWSEALHLAGKDIAQVLPLEKWIRNAERHVLRSHPAVWGYDLGDEPGAASFPFYGEVVRAIREKCPEKALYLNLYPNCVPKADARQDPDKPNVFWDADTYEEYIGRFCESVPLDYVCYDFYLYRQPERRIPLSYENMRTVSEACRRHGRDFWTVLQVNSSEKGLPTSVARLRFQAYQAMAYGATTLLWACYSPGWWHHNVLTKDGEKTGQYERLRQVNGEIHAFGRQYMRFRTVETALVGDFGAKGALFRPPREGVLQKGEKAGTTPVSQRFSNGVVRDLRAADGKALIVGDMVGRADKACRAVFVCAADDPMEASPCARELVFGVADGFRVGAMGVGGKLRAERGEDGLFRLPLRSSEGVFVAFRPE